MTSKVYRTAQGKSVDLGTIMLRNEHVRAVGNMNVNARGDKLDHNNRVIETKPRQIQKQNARTTNVSAAPVQTSANASKNKQAKREKTQAQEYHAVYAPPPVVEEAPVAVVAPPAQHIATPGKVLEGGLAATIARQREAKQQAEKPRQQPQQEGGLAAAIARQKEVKQELEKSRRQQAQAKGVRKI
jgi:hypothetical protein